MDLTKWTPKKKKTSAEERKFLASHGVKWCYGCNSTHELSAFGLDKGTADGVSVYCKDSRRRLSRKKPPSIELDVNKAIEAKKELFKKLKNKHRYGTTS